MAKVYMYVVDRDFGFAPNPFHGVCTLATCKPAIRSTAQVGDWIIGMGGSRLGATGRCLFAMRVTNSLTFDEYWSDPVFRAKRPIRNGSKKMMIGDNIYRQEDGLWRQADSHHSLPDGSVNEHNLKRDTKINRVLISSQFFYFGVAAPEVPAKIIEEIGFANGVGHRVYSDVHCKELINWLLQNYHQNLNQLLGDPFDFDQCSARYSVQTNRVSSD